WFGIGFHASARLDAHEVCTESEASAQQKKAWGGLSLTNEVGGHRLLDVFRGKKIHGLTESILVDDDQLAKLLPLLDWRCDCRCMFELFLKIRRHLVPPHMDWIERGGQVNLGEGSSGDGQRAEKLVRS